MFETSLNLDFMRTRAAKLYTFGFSGVQADCFKGDLLLCSAPCLSEAIQSFANCIFCPNYLINFSCCTFKVLIGTVDVKVIGPPLAP